ncbi:MAG: hypothetical protein NC251_02190 [Lachnoclostridium sp.]|nr:hypothetical protein [Lachnospira sp.]MCM1247219.1 hypothetical protein [Lachnoclostridium sp.]
MEETFNPVNDPLVLEQLEKDNYLIEYENCDNDLCCIYFSSHAVYFPETRENFIHVIIENDRFEWYKKRVPNVQKHIFLRDIRKQFYVEGINSRLNSMDLLIEWLKKETEGYHVTTLGSSAGGYASAAAGTALGADKIYCFSAQFSLRDDFAYPTKELLLKHERDPEYYKWYNIVDRLNKNVIYVYPSDSDCDIVQAVLLKKQEKDREVCVISIKSSTHGVPIYHSSLTALLLMPTDRIREYSGVRYTPFTFSVKMIGVIRSVCGLFKEFLRKAYIKLRALKNRHRRNKACCLYFY